MEKDPRPEKLDRLSNQTDQTSTWPKQRLLYDTTAWRVAVLATRESHEYDWDPVLGAFMSAQYRLLS